MRVQRWDSIKNILESGGAITELLIAANIYPRITEAFLFQQFLNPSASGNRMNFEREKEEKDELVINSSRYLEYLHILIGGYAVLITQEQQAVRIHRYYQENNRRTRNQRNSNPLHEMEFCQELENPGHENWSPRKRSEWLLFEIDMDLMIRRRQATVAERMLHPEGNSNALLQLNMGEGKTAVIVPLVLLSLANGLQLSRVTVLKPLFAVNREALMHRIGGLLSRRLYSFPCRRDFLISIPEGKRILAAYKECMHLGGVVMTIPEHRLSFQLKSYERIYNGSLEEGLCLREVEAWLRANVRDILDESDEILQVKYQLIYTMGKPVPVNGGNLRWLIAQKLLKLVPRGIEDILVSNENGGRLVELKKRKAAHKFSYCRILRPECYSTLSNRLGELVIKGRAGMQIPDIPASKHPLLLRFLTEEGIGKETFEEVYSLYPQDSHREIILIIRGMLACGVLTTVFEKRWRVNFGVSQSGYRRMAVPFRAKDVAAERTEFGHLDIAILLTQLSYYYSGLTDSQLDQAFSYLYLQSSPKYEYDSWLATVQPTTKGYESIRHLSGLNPKDFYQKNQILYPLLRKNMATIDFWLNHAVYPSESKQFGLKIGSSPWDLCLKTAYPTTGFSGTNDSKILLPKTIAQRDLLELQGTNGEVLRNLIGSSENSYENLKFGTTGKMILKKLAKSNISLLLDVGALMLEMDNEEVARTWLSLVDENNVDGAVYFDEQDRLVVLPRHQSTPIQLGLSTFRTRLDRTVIYLDDVHTRGTDLKIPPGTVGVCTLGKGVTKDKLVQGCMRMRKLGNGHTVRFWASQEVHDSILHLRGDREAECGDRGHVTTLHVLDWAIENCRQEIQNGFIQWATAGVYQTQKLSAEVIFGSSSKTEIDLKKVASSCALKETTDLVRMYGTVRTVKTIPTVVQHQLSRVERELSKHSKGTARQVLKSIVSNFGKHVVGHCEKYVPNLPRSNPMDEEQEREIEHELETQVERKNPPKFKPLLHSTNQCVRRFIEGGDLREIETWAIKLPLSFRNTSIWKHVQCDTWGSDIYATFDFVRVSKLRSDLPSQEIIRPLNWIVSVQVGGRKNRIESNSLEVEKRTVLLLLSPFEVNAFLPLFGNRSKGTLHMVAPRLSPFQSTLHNNGGLQVPPFNTLNFNSNLSAAIFLFSGSTYFQCQSEEDGYCKLLGFCLQPRSAEEEIVFSQGQIENGFLRPGPWRLELGYVGCRFQRNPEALVRAIIESRHGTFPTQSHVAKVIFTCSKPLSQKSGHGRIPAELKKLQSMSEDNNKDNGNFDIFTE